MMDKDHLFSYIDRTWTAQTSAELAKRVATEVLLLRAQEASCLTYSDFMRFSGKSALDETLHAAVTILTAGKHPLLKAFGIFVDENGDEFPIRGGDFHLLLQENQLVHPKTGELIENALQLVAPVFERIS